MLEVADSQHPNLNLALQVNVGLIARQRPFFSKQLCTRDTYSRFKAVAAVGGGRCHKHACAVDPTLMHSSQQARELELFQQWVYHAALQKKNMREEQSLMHTPTTLKRMKYKTVCLPKGYGMMVPTLQAFLLMPALKIYGIPYLAVWKAFSRSQVQQYILSPWLVVHGGLHVGKDSISARCPLIIHCL